MKSTLTVRATILAPIEKVWAAYTNPADIKQWNAASDDWHTTSATVDLRPGGKFCFRMEVKDGSMGFDFEGIYTEIEAPHRLAYEFGDRKATVEFAETEAGVSVTVAFEAEESHSFEQQEQGWQAILDSFANHLTSLL